MENPIKIDDLGVPPFMEPPYTIIYHLILFVCVFHWAYLDSIPRIPLQLATPTTLGKFWSGLEYDISMSQNDEFHKMILSPKVIMML